MIRHKRKITFPPFEILDDINYVDKEVDIADLKLVGNRILDIVALSVPKNYVEDCRRYKHFETPVITSDNLVLSHKHDILAARMAGKKTMKVTVAENLAEKEFIRFTLKSIRFFELKHDQKIELINLLTYHLQSIDTGWFKELDFEYKNINDKLEQILNADSQTIKGVKRKAKNEEVQKMKALPEPELEQEKTEPIDEPVAKAEPVDFTEIAIMQKGGKYELHINGDYIQNPIGFVLKQIGRKLQINLDLSNFEIINQNIEAA